MLGSPQRLLPKGEFRSRQLAWPQNTGRSALHGSQHLFWAAVACVVLTCNLGWLLLRHPLFYSVSSLSPGHSLVCPWGWECCFGDQVSHWDMEIPTRLCKPVSLSFPSGHSLSRHLGTCQGTTDRALQIEVLQIGPPTFLSKHIPSIPPKSGGSFWSSGKAQFFWNPFALLVVVFPAILWMPRILFVRAFKTQKPERNIFFLCFAFSHSHFRSLWLGWLGGNNT